MDNQLARQRTFQPAWRWLVLVPAALILLGWLINTPSGLLGKADAVGYAVCHRIDARSFHLGVRQLPLCARCSGMFLGAVLGLAFQFYQGRRGSMPPLKIAAIFGVFVLAFAVDGLNSYLHFFPGAPGAYEPHNWLRLATGTGMGLAIAAALAPAFRQTVWTTWEQRPAFGSLREVGLLLLLAAGLDLILLTENPLILYPLALLSAGGVLLILALVYTMVWVMLFKAENRFTHLRQLLFPLACGTSLALLQIAVFDWGRFLLTGTWQGFNL